MDIRKNIITFLLLLPGGFNACIGTNGVNTDATNGSNRHASNQKKNSMIQNVSPLYGSSITQDSTQQITFQLSPGVMADSVVLTIGDRRIATVDSTGYAYKTNRKHPTGRIIYKITAYRDSTSESRLGEFTVLAAQAPTLYGHKIQKRYPHRTDAYTQGLLWHNGYLYESTGQEGQSSLRKVELATGKPIVTTLLDNHLFGEGVALLHNKFYQLTWQNNKAFVYDMENFNKIGEFDYSGEGWGLATDGKWLYMSDGSEKINVLDPDTFTRIRTLEVYTDQSKVPYINEMEWIKGELWANIYMTETIIRIDPQTGVVTGVIDMSGLLDPADITPTTDVLNGIAYDSKTGRIFVTGKNWGKLFEVSIHAK